MPSKRVFLAAFFVAAVCGRAVLAEAAELKLRQVREGNLKPGQAQSFVVSLGAADFARLGVTPTGRHSLSKPILPRASLFAAPE